MLACLPLALLLSSLYLASHSISLRSPRVTILVSNLLSSLKSLIRILLSVLRNSKKSTNIVKEILL